ncbi:ypt2 [Symbiodinium sp. KB8]|nr:ypt2 [Symbiodinium sp. KB8]
MDPECDEKQFLTQLNDGQVVRLVSSTSAKLTPLEPYIFRAYRASAQQLRKLELEPDLEAYSFEVVEEGVPALGMSPQPESCLRILPNRSVDFKGGRGKWATFVIAARDAAGVALRSVGHGIEKPAFLAASSSGFVAGASVQDPASRWLFQAHVNRMKRPFQDFEFSTEQYDAFAQDGFVILKGAVESDGVQAALRSINHLLGKGPEAWMVDTDAPTEPGEAPKRKLPTSSHPSIEALVTRTCLSVAVERLLGGVPAPPGAGNLAVRFPVVDRLEMSGGSLTDAAKRVVERDDSTQQFHIDGMGKESPLPFSVLCKVALSDQTEEHSGNFTVFPGSHRNSDVVRWYFAHLSTATSPKPSRPEVGSPLQLRLAPGDVVLAHPYLCHRVGTNTSPHIRPGTTRYAAWQRRRYPESERNHSDPQDLQLFPIRIYTPSGDVLLEQKLPGDRTVRSILQTLRTEKRGRLSLLQGTEVIPQGKKLSELNLAEDEGSCLVRRATGNYTLWEDNVYAEHHLVKCLLVGAAKAGKSTWMLAFGRHSFTSQYQPTIGVEFKLLRLQSEDGLRMKIQLWDTAGQQRFRTITNAYYRGASGIMAFFSLHSRESLTEVLRMLEEAEGRHPLSCRCVCLDPEVTQEEAEQLAQQKGWPFFATSSKSGVNIDDPLFGWLDMLLDERMKMQRLRNMQEKAELDGCTFKPEIDQKSEELISQRLARLKITGTLYDSLYEDAIRRRERQLESLRALPPGVTFQPDIGMDHYRPPNDETKEDFLNRLAYSKSYSERWLSLRRQSQENGFRSKDREQPEFHPQTGRGPLVERNRAGLPIGDFLYEFGRGKATSVTAQVPQDPDQSPAPKMGDNSRQLFEETKRRSYRHLFDSLTAKDPEGQLAADTITLDGLDADLCEFLRPLASFLEATGKRIDFSAFGAAMDLQRQQAVTPTAHLFARNAAKNGKVKGDEEPPGPRIDHHSHRLAARHRSRSVPVYEQLHRERDIRDARMEERRLMAEEQELQECTFRPKLRSRSAGNLSRLPSPRGHTNTRLFGEFARSASLQRDGIMSPRGGPGVQFRGPPRTPRGPGLPGGPGPISKGTGEAMPKLPRPGTPRTALASAWPPSTPPGPHVPAPSPGQGPETEVPQHATAEACTDPSQ